MTKSMISGLIGELKDFTYSTTDFTTVFWLHMVLCFPVVYIGYLVVKSLVRNWPDFTLDMSEGELSRITYPRHTGHHNVKLVLDIFRGWEVLLISHIMNILFQIINYYYAI